MAEVLHFVISDCVAKAGALSPPKLLACAPSLREVTCEDCKRFIKETFAKWTDQYHTKLGGLQREVRRNAQTLDHQRKLIEKLDHVINGSTEGFPRRGEGDLCPVCRYGVLETRSYRGQPFIGCEAFPKCEYTCPAPRVPA